MFCLKRVRFGVFHGIMSNGACAAANKFSTILRSGRHEIGERGGTRTLDLLIKSQLLYRLSYALVTRRKDLPDNCCQPFRRPTLGAV